MRVMTRKYAVGRKLVRMIPDPVGKDIYIYILATHQKQPVDTEMTGSSPPVKSVGYRECEVSVGLLFRTRGRCYYSKYVIFLCVNTNN